MFDFKQIQELGGKVTEFIDEAKKNIHGVASNQVALHAKFTELEKKMDAILAHQEGKTDVHSS